MKNFKFYNPTKIIFGEGTIKEIAGEIPREARVLLTYGGGSIKRNGLIRTSFLCRGVYLAVSCMSRRFGPQDIGDG
ncbi:MAG: hypothetical protein WAP08_12175 [Smithellaceae bacterium]